MYRNIQTRLQKLPSFSSIKLYGSLRRASILDQLMPTQQQKISLTVKVFRYVMEIANKI